MTSLPYSLMTVKVIELKTSLLVIFKILRLFFNTFTADDKYSLLKRDNLTEPIETQLSKKQKTFSQFLLKVLKCR